MQLLIISGKGGTGKTTIAAALSELAQCDMVVDCDVEAANLYLLLQEREVRRASFEGSKKAQVDSSRCIECGACTEACRFGAINNGMVEPLRCEGCGLCVYLCPEQALHLIPQQTGEVVLSDTKWGSMVWADMIVGADGSGKLVTELRNQAKGAEHALAVLDGSPGIGCTVMASITGCDAALIVTEPTYSGLSDLSRISSLLKQFRVPSFVCINRYDLSLELTSELVKYCEAEGILLVGKIPYDPTVREAIGSLQGILAYPESPASQAIHHMWKSLLNDIRGLSR